MFTPRLTCTSATRVHRTAMAELDRTLRMAASRAPWLGEIAEVRVGMHTDPSFVNDTYGKSVARFADAGPTLDSFAVVREGARVSLVGNTLRGMMQAVHEFDDAVMLRRGLPDGTRNEGVFQIPRRIFHQRFDNWPGTREDVRFISRLGASECLVCHDWQGEARRLHGYVRSPIFPDALPADLVSEQNARLHRLLDDCADYGLDASLWITELPCQGGPWVPEPARQAFLSRFPAEVLSDSGTYQGKVLCFRHPAVQAFYKDVLARFFAEFPGVGTLFVFNVDSGGEFCDPMICPRCKGVSKIEQRDRLLRFFREHGDRVRPGLRVLTTNWGWDRDVKDFLSRQHGLPQGTGLFLAAQRDGWQPERQLHDVMREARRICAERAQVFLGYDNFLWGDDTVHSIGDIQDYPLGVGAKMRRWHELRVDGVFDHWGTCNQDVPSNAIACREFFLNPTAEPAMVTERIAHEQFGIDLVEPVLEAWSALEDAHAALSEACTWSPWQWPGWYGGRDRAPTPAVLEAARESLAKTAESPKPSGTTTYNGGDLGAMCEAVSDAWREAMPHYHRAIRAMRRAVAEADGSPVGYAHWWAGLQPAPSKRDHLRRQLLYLESMAVIGGEIGLHFGLHAAWERTRPDEMRYKREAESLLWEDAAACRDAALQVERFPATTPAHIREWAAKYRAKADAIAAYIAGRAV